LSITLVLYFASCWQATARDWSVDPLKSSVGFAVSVNGQLVKGRFQRWTSAITFDERDLNSARARIVFDLGQVASGDPARDKALQGPQWFDVAGTAHTGTIASPNEAVFETSSIERSGDGSYHASGMLYMRGVSMPVEFDFVLITEANTARMQSKLVIDRTQWGVGQGDFSDETPVSTKVEIAIDLFAVTQ
jgi:polyisoprenoid-binding protein YceI